MLTLSLSLSLPLSLPLSLTLSLSLSSSLSLPHPCSHSTEHSTSIEDVDGFVDALKQKVVSSCTCIYIYIFACSSLYIIMYPE